MSLPDQLRAIDIRNVMSSYGVTFDRAGKALCPFHDEKTPSLSIYKNKFKCFGCGANGDVVDFVRMKNGCDFKDALRHLGIERGPVDQKKIKRDQYERRLVDEFREWERKADTVCARCVLTINEIIDNLKPEEVIENGFLYHVKSRFEYLRAIFWDGSDLEKMKIRRAHPWLADYWFPYE